MDIRQMPKEMLCLIRLSDHFAEEIQGESISEKLGDLIPQFDPPEQFLHCSIHVIFEDVIPGIGDFGITPKSPDDLSQELPGI
jgi:hypothetical protein